MKNDPILNLALATYSNRGVFALLLGSGVSRSSGIPTGWEIVLDLIRKLAHLQGEPCEPSPEEWYQLKFGRKPSYSDILGKLTRTPAERMQLLRAYFEPTEQEREEGLKLPTQAHHAIAGLIAKGYIRVVITTNFDRLLELALAEVGVPPYVISTPDAAEGALPLAHSRCTVIKVNGDYLDIRLKNTDQELEQYDARMNTLLDQVLDEYGLIVCGWSGDWDTGLRSALERCKSRRFSMYWTAKDPLNACAKGLAHRRNATDFRICGADEFFTELRDKVLALETVSQQDILSTQVAVARMKKYLADDSQLIDLNDLLYKETERVHATLTGPRFPLAKTPLGPADIEARLRNYEATIQTVLYLMICGAYWGKPQHDEILLRCFKRLADQSGPHGGPGLQRYPALVLLYGMSLSAIGRDNYRFLRLLFELKIRVDAYIHHPEQTVAKAVNHLAVMTCPDQRELLEKRVAPLSERLFTLLRDPVREYLPDDLEYDRTFDWLEYLLCLCYHDARETRSTLESRLTNDPQFTLDELLGRFAKKQDIDGAPAVLWETEIKENGTRPPKVDAVIRAGFFESAKQHDDKYRAIKTAFDRYVRNNVGSHLQEGLVY